MEVAVFAASRNPRGQVSEAANAVLEGVRSANGEGRLIHLGRLDIRRCQRCEEAGEPGCLADGRCVVEDDFGSALESIRGSDGVVFVSPVQFGGSAPCLVALLDRLRRVCRNQRARRGISGTPAVGVCVGGGASGCSQKLEGILIECGFEVVKTHAVHRGRIHLSSDALRAAGEELIARAARENVA